MNEIKIGNITVGIKVRAKVGFLGAPRGTTGKVIQVTTPRNKHLEKEYAIQWDLFRSRPLVDWFTESEFRDFLEVLE
ncbi:MAG: hypothetical protein ACYDAO_10560 [Thermoplasmataceae archaeon]